MAQCMYCSCDTRHYYTSTVQYTESSVLYEKTTIRFEWYTNHEISQFTIRVVTSGNCASRRTRWASLRRQLRRLPRSAGNLRGTEDVLHVYVSVADINHSISWIPEKDNNKKKKKREMQVLVTGENIFLHFLFWQYFLFYSTMTSAVLPPRAIYKDIKSAINNTSTPCQLQYPLSNHQLNIISLILYYPYHNIQKTLTI